MGTRRVRGLLTVAAASLLGPLAAFTISFGGPRLPFAGSAVEVPPAEPVLESFSVRAGGPATVLGLHPADILIAGPFVAIPCANLGLICTDPDTGAQDDLSDIAYEYDFFTMDLPPVEFSVAAGASGAAGTVVELEATCSPSEAQADVFSTQLTATNMQVVDGDGVACSTNAGLGIGLDEAAPTPEDLDALERDPYQFVDLDHDSIPERPVYFTLAPGSPTLPLIPATSADILVTSGTAFPAVWASATDLGLTWQDIIGGLCVNDNGDGLYDPATDRVLFSLAAGSPSLTAISAGPADILRAGPAVDYGAAALGLGASDQVDALKCAADDFDLDTYFDIKDNCPAWPNPGQALPPWPVPANDPDCDGFTTAVENFSGTDPLLQCGTDNWPPDLAPATRDRLVNILDAAEFRFVWNSVDGDGRYVKRKDLNADGRINILDVAPLRFFWNKTCTP